MDQPTQERHLALEVKELPPDLVELDRVLCDLELMMVLLERWRQEVVETGRLVLTDGRPTIPMETYVRLMILKARYRWGYRSLVAEVSDSIHLRRFCRVSLGERVPDDSSVPKLTRRIGAGTVNELTRTLIDAAVREKRCRPRAVRIDSTVVEADVRYPTDADLEVASQIRQRVKGEPISNRLVSLADPDARPIRKGKLGKPNEIGYVSP